MNPIGLLSWPSLEDPDSRETWSAFPQEAGCAQNGKLPLSRSGNIPTAPFSSPQARPGEVLTQPKQKCLSHTLALDERLDSDLNLALAAWFMPSWTLELPPLNGQHCPYPTPPCPAVSMSCSTAISLARSTLASMGLKAKLLSFLVLAPPHPAPCFPASCSQQSEGGSASLPFLLMALPVNTAIPGGPKGKVWMGSHHARSHGSHNRNRKPCHHPSSEMQGGSLGPSSTSLLSPASTPWTKPCWLFLPTVTRTWPLLSIFMAAT